MAHVVVLGAGLGGTIMAYELRDKLGKEHRVSVVSNGPVASRTATHSGHRTIAACWQISSWHLSTGHG
jgi:NADH dehydrogenase FAD-containing subunit